MIEFLVKLVSYSILAFFGLIAGFFLIWLLGPIIPIIILILIVT